MGIATTAGRTRRRWRHIVVASPASSHRAPLAAAIQDPSRWRTAANPVHAQRRLPSAGFAAQRTTAPSITRPKRSAPNRASATTRYRVDQRRPRAGCRFTLFEEVAAHRDVDDDEGDRDDRRDQRAADHATRAQPRRRVRQSEPLSLAKVSLSSERAGQCTNLAKPPAARSTAEQITSWRGERTAALSRLMQPTAHRDLQRSDRTASAHQP